MSIIKPTNRIVIVIEGGVIQDIVANNNNVDIIVVDYDVDDEMEGEEFQAHKDEMNTPFYSNRYPQSTDSLSQDYVARIFNETK